MDKAASREFEVFCGNEIKPDDWFWCKRCHRCYQAFKFRKMTTKGETFLLCHYKDCHGDLPIDSRPWNNLVKNKPKLPPIPLKGTVYNI